MSFEEGKLRARISEGEISFPTFEELQEEIKSDLDIFDLICHIAWDAPALTRKERAENVRKRNYWTKYGEQARKILNALLDKYAENGIYLPDYTDGKKITEDDVFIVWMCKTLQNNKALVSTTPFDGMYYELTYNGDKNELYFDAYKKWENKCIVLTTGNSL